MGIGDVVAYKDVCGRCQFWKPIRGGNGECLRYPPTIVRDAGESTSQDGGEFVRTVYWKWCGEFRERDDDRSKVMVRLHDFNHPALSGDTLDVLSRNHVVTVYDLCEHSEESLGDILHAHKQCLADVRAFCSAHQITLEDAYNLQYEPTKRS